MTEDIYIRLSPELTTAVATTPDGAEELPLETPSAITTLTAMLLGAGQRERLRQGLLVTGIEALRQGLALLVDEPEEFSDPEVYANHVITLARIANELGERSSAKA
jgi:hypothetical protein